MNVVKTLSKPLFAEFCAVPVMQGAALLSEVAGVVDAVWGLLRTIPSKLCVNTYGAEWECRETEL